MFGSIGFVAFVYGKRMSLWKPMFLGLGLMIYPYFVSDDTIMIAIGSSDRSRSSLFENNSEGFRE